MHLAALLVGLIACAAIVVLGVRFILQPRQATLDFGIAADNVRGLTEIKGARDITSGVVPLVAWASGGSTTLGWVLVAAALTPTAGARCARNSAEPSELQQEGTHEQPAVLLSGEQTDGRFAMLDMLIPPGGGPPPHRHDFEECFRVLAGSIEVHLRDLPPVRLEAGDSANIPANAPHAFRNTADGASRSRPPARSASEKNRVFPAAVASSKLMTLFSQRSREQRERAQRTVG